MEDIDSFLIYFGHGSHSVVHRQGPVAEFFEYSLKEYYRAERGSFNEIHLQLGAHITCIRNEVKYLYLG